MLLVESEFEELQLCSESRTVMVVGIGNVLGWDLFGDKLPIELESIESIGETFVSFHGEVNFGFLFEFGDSEAFGGGGDDGAEVDFGGVEDVIAVEAVEFVDDESDLVGKSAEEVADLTAIYCWNS